MATRTWWNRWLCVALVAFAATACRDDGDAEPTPRAAPISDDRLAESMLLDSDDFPDDWVHLAYNQDDLDEAYADFGVGSLDACRMESFDGETGRALNGEFSDRNTTMLSINPRVIVFDTDEHARAAVADIVRVQRCEADAIGTGLDVDETFALGPATFESRPSEPFDAQSVIRTSTVQIYKTETPPNEDLLVFDVVHLVEGRVVYEVVGFQRHTPIDEELLRTYVEAARGKIRQQP